jgi:exportin-2 (importin alpha re-exporter)
LFSLGKATAVLIDQNTGNGVALETLFRSVHLMCKIFYSLNAIDLPEFFEDHMNDWMTLFRKYLVYQTELPQLIGDEVG